MEHGGIWTEPFQGTYGAMGALRLPGAGRTFGGGARPPIHYLTGLRPTETSAIVTGLARAGSATTSELSMNFLRPLRVSSGSFMGRARMVHANRFVPRRSMGRVHRAREPPGGDRER